MDNKEKSPEQELIESIGLMIEKGMESNTNIYTGVVKSVDGKRAVVAVNGQNQNVSIATADVSSGNVVRVFVPEGNMSAAFIIKAEASGGGEPTTTAYGDLTGKPQINGVTLVDNKTSKELNLYGTGNAPPYPVTSVNGQTGDVTIEVGGNVDSVNGKTGVVVLSAADVGALPNTTVIPDKTSQLDNDSGYITNSALTDYAKKTEIPKKTSELTNDSGYITANDVPVKSVDGATGDVVTNAVKTTTQTLTDTQKQQARTNIGAGTSSFDGDYNSLTNKPTIPTKTSQLTNDSGFITDAALTGYAKTTDIPTKTSQLDNDSHYITASEAPVQSVNTKTGAVVLTQDDVGDGTTYVRTHNDFTDALKTQINTNKDNIAMAEGDIDGLQTDVGTLKTNVSSLQTALTSKQDVIVGAASTIAEDNLVADRALISDSSGKVAVSNVTSTELGYLDGVTSNVQTQLDKKLENIPIATSTTLGGVKPVAKTSNMTQSVGVDANGALYTAPGGGGTGSGDMLKSVYDPQNKSTDIFKYAKDVADARQAKILVDGILEGDGAGNISAAETIQTELLDVEVLPTVTTADNGKILKVTNGAWVAQQPKTEAWTFTLEDGSTITKNVCIE